MSELSTLTTAEESALTNHEAVIESGLKTFVEVGTALAAIRDARLYRKDYGTFESYCQTRWALTRNRAYELIGAAEVANQMLEISNTAPATESHAAELAKLKTPEERVEAYEKAGGRNATAKDVQAAVEEVKAGVVEADEVIPPASRAERINYQPSNGDQYAEMAISQLQKIQPNDTQRSRAFERVVQWIADNK